jgi:hypothetical protein
MSLLDAPSRYEPSVRGDAMLITHGREGTDQLLATALLLDAVLGGHLDVASAHPLTDPELAPRRAHLVARPELEDAPPLLADLRTRVLEALPASPTTWIERAAVFAPSRVAIELIAAGAAEPLARRFQRHFTLSVDAHAEAGARQRLLDPSSPAVAAALWACGGFRALRFPPPQHTLPPAAREILAALRPDQHLHHG